ncbi:MAG: hypothetical protein IC227_03680 [Enterococcus lacertideformus]|uniref:Mga helix-turn-helix domain-containing protein n=1 Tax=Enterococcus lacertideformus TaxID=2771493 RepID=A0A931AVK5_9ENTE|nr:hypothetical protein [Enterococcus lacertideformus]
MVNEFLPVSDDTFNKLVCFYGVLLYRVSLKKFIVPEEKEVYQQMLASYSFIPKENFIRNTFHFSSIHPKILASEYDNFNFFIRIFIPEFIFEKNIVDLGKAYENSSKELIVFFRGMIGTFQKKYCPRISKKYYYHILYYSVLLYNAAIHLNLSNLSMWKTANIFIEKNEMKFAKEIATFLGEYVQKHSVKELDADYFQERQQPYLANLLTLYAVMFDKPQIFINCSFLSDYSTQVFVKNHLLRLYSKNVLLFTNDVVMADIFVVDRFVLGDIKGQCVLIDDIYNSQEWQILLTKISDLIIKKSKSAQY